MDQSRENRIEDSQDEIDIGELLRYLKTKWIVLVAVFLIGVIGAGVGTFPEKPRKMTATLSSVLRL